MRARALVVAWTEAYGKWENFAWRLSVTADRLINWLCAGPSLFAPLEGETRTAVLETLGRQLRHLQFSGVEETDPISRFRIAVALCLGGAATDDGRKSLDAGLAMLEAECNAQILAELDTLIGRWAKDRNAGECFGDFVIRQGIVAATRSAFCVIAPFSR